MIITPVNASAMTQNLAAALLLTVADVAVMNAGCFAAMPLVPARQIRMEGQINVSSGRRYALRLFGENLRRSLRRVMALLIGELVRCR